MSNEFQVEGATEAAPFTLRIHRGDGMALLAMNWKNGRPPNEFVGFAIEYLPPGASAFVPLNNRLSFEPALGQQRRFSSLVAPIQKFRWVHFPFDAERTGEYTYRVTPVMMDGVGRLDYGIPQVASLELRRETHPGVLNVAYTRGFVASQAFVDRYESAGSIRTLLPSTARKSLTFTPTHPKTAAALKWMGFEARDALLEVLDEAIADADASVRVIAYDLNEPEVVSRLEVLGIRLRVIIDDSGDHASEDATKPSAEDQAEQRLVVTAGRGQVKRQDLGGLQHNKTIVVDGPLGHTVLCGSTNFSWRGFYVQNNNVIVMRGANAVEPFAAAFERYWLSDAAQDFSSVPPIQWQPLGLPGVDASVIFSPHRPAEKFLGQVGAELATVSSSMFYALAFLGQTTGAVRDAVLDAVADPAIFVYGMSDQKVDGIELQKPGERVSVTPAALKGNLPKPFSAEPVGGSGIRMHHKFVVLDFDTPTARVLVGSFNFSPAADTGNGENLLLIRDRRVAVSFMVQALSIFDHYSFRNRRAEGEEAAARALIADPQADPDEWMNLRKPPVGEEPAWFERDYDEPARIRDRLLFAG